MLKSLFWTLAGFVAAGGGLWIAALFVPSIALVVKATLDFARSPFGMIVAALVAGFVLFTSGWVGGDLHGSGQVKADWKAANIQAARAAREREATVDRTAKAEADLTLNAINSYAGTLEQKVADYAKSHEKNRPACPATGNDVFRLLDIH